jgi:predicted aminopeptidase
VRHWLQRLLLSCSLFLLTACDTLGYYGQAVSGQLKILGQRRAIPSILAADSTPPALREQLQLVQELRAFAASELRLPVGNQFSSYVDLQRPYVVWNVFAAPEFALEPLSWCFPVAGCVSYRGYFSEAAARNFASALQTQGYEVYVGGVTAYSTLGWFADPVLSTVLGREPWQLASLVFHELAHQVVYVPGDTQFNESFATAVEQVGLERWLGQAASGADAEAVLLQAATQLQRREQFVALVQATVSDLRQIYTSQQEPMLLREARQARLQQLRAEYRELRQQWGGYAAYDGWFAQELNNAQLLTVATYNAQVPAFRRLLQDCGEDLPCFYAKVQQLADLDVTQRQAALVLQ